MALQFVLWVTFMNKTDNSEKSILMVREKVNAIVDAVWAEGFEELLFNGVAISFHDGFSRKFQTSPGKHPLATSASTRRIEFRFIPKLWHV